MPILKYFDTDTNEWLPAVVGKQGPQGPPGPGLVICVTDGDGGYQSALGGPVPPSDGYPRMFIGPDDPSDVAGITLSIWDLWVNTA